MPELVKISSVAEAQLKIELIKRQGEGTSSSPFSDARNLAIAPARELAHYYRFGEMYAEHRLQPDATAPTGWSFTGPPLLFPGAGDVYLMAEVPPGGYAESDAFDREYTATLKLLHEAWGQGDGQKLTDAISVMDTTLGDEARKLLVAGLPSGTGTGIKGPDFRFMV